MQSINNIESAVALEEIFRSPISSIRLSAALSVGSRPKTEFVATLINQCAVESDFFVRDMLTWALLRHDQNLVFENLKLQLASPLPQARSQALHTLTKLKQAETWLLITDAILFDADAEVRRAAWRLASQFVPIEERNSLVDKLLRFLGTGSEEERLSLSRALATLGETAVERLEPFANDPEVEKSTHAKFTLALIMDPQLTEATSSALATKIDLLSKAPKPTSES